MKPTLGSNSHSARQRRIGRKALQADRISRALGTSQAKQSKRSRWRMPVIKRRTLIVSSAIVTVVAVVGMSGSRIYFTQAAGAEKAEATKQEKITKAKADAASACREKKAEAKADQLGKVTYDQLYDGNSCDK